MSRFRKENRFDVFVYECLFLGFLIGFISAYHHITFLLIIFLVIQIIGVLYTEKRFYLINNGFKSLVYIVIHLFQFIINRLYNGIKNYISRPRTPKVLVTKKLPEKYLYTYHLKPTNALQLQQVRTYFDLVS